MSHDPAPSPMNRRSAITRLGGVALLAGVPALRKGRDAEDSQQGHDADFERILRLASVPSMSYAMVDGDRVTTNALGVRRSGDSERVTSETVYAAASQRVLEKLTGKSFGLLARERVFQPLGMKRTSVMALAELEPYQAAGHNFRGEIIPPFGRPTLLELRRRMAERGVAAEAATTQDSEQALQAAESTLPVLPNFLSPNAAASLQTTAADFGLFLKHLVTARRKGGPAATIVQQMTTTQIRCNEAIQWGLGVGLEEFNGRSYAWQWGDNPGFKNFFFADPKGEKAMVIFTNGDRGARVYERVIRALTGDDHPTFLFG